MQLVTMKNSLLLTIFSAILLSCSSANKSEQKTEVNPNEEVVTEAIVEQVESAAPEKVIEIKPIELTENPTIDQYDSAKLLLDHLEETPSPNCYSNSLANAFSKSFNEKILGAIGKNSRRIKVKFLSIEQESDSTYIVSGKTSVRDNLVDFRGYLKILECYKLKYQDFQQDGIEQSLYLGVYELFEDKDHEQSGTFSGLFSFQVYTENTNELQFDKIKWSADSYTNLAFNGNWSKYGSSNKSFCSWGISRIPGAPYDMDIGAGEFAVSDKYLEYGWADYMTFFTDQDPEANKRENREWWKE